jgi:hypothetical protein
MDVGFDQLALEVQSAQPLQPDIEHAQRRHYAADGAPRNSGLPRPVSEL